MIKASVIVAGFLAASIWLIQSPHASAQAADQQPTAPPQAAAAAPYEFTAQQGNSMSVLARRAIQLYDEKSNDIALPEPCIIAAETHIVQTLGPRWLNLGEKFKIDESVVAEFARKANELTEPQRAAWKVYSDNADFTLTDVKLTSELVSQANDQQQSSEQQNSDSQSSSGENSEQGEQSNADSNTTDGSAPWYWWVVGIGTIGALYYLLGGRPKPQSK